MTMTAYHGITLAVIAVVAIGTAMYTYFSSRNRAQEHHHERRRSSVSPPSFDFPEREIPDASRNRRPPDQETCTICFELLRRKTTVALTCGHMFHSHCITMWLHNSKSCPMCRRSAL